MKPRTPTPFLALVSMVGLSACAANAPPATAAPRCEAEPAQAFIGQVATQDLGAQLLAASGATMIRWVAFGQMVTMEFREGRLTVGLDAQNRVSSVACT